jgi:MscS family membrane protein
MSKKVILNTLLMLVAFAGCMLGVMLLQQSAIAGSVSPLIPTPASESVGPPAVLVDTLGRATPKGMVKGFLRAVEDEDYSRASEYLDLRGLSASRQKTAGPDLARDLQTLLDQGGWIEGASKLSDNPEGNTNDGLANAVDLVGSIRAGDKSSDLLAERIDDAKNGPVWKFSKDTVAQIPELLEKMATGILDSILPEFLIENKWYGVPVGHWLAIFTIALTALLFAWVLTYGIIAVIRRISPSARYGQARLVLDAFIWPIRIYIALGLFVVLARASGISIVARQNFTLLAEIAAWLSLWWFLWRIIDIVASNFQNRMSQEMRRSALSSVIFFRRSARLVLSIVAIALAMDRVGLNVSGWFTALGIGGIALAFGAQKTIENFVVGLTLIIDQPVRVGDSCKIGNITGTVEDIGMRSTRIKTLDQTMVTFPNGQLATLPIENHALRTRFWFHHTLALRYETSQGQLRQLLDKLRGFILEHPLVNKEDARVRFREFGASSLNVELFALIVAESPEDFLKTQEEMLFKVMAIMEECGVGFAFPSQTVYMAQDTAPGKSAAPLIETPAPAKKAGG